jgi:2-keto-4-pentenoate hydratase/2-oxohepta-3-ene-1,7-dioic acid hydratase in catechol pathway
MLICWARLLSRDEQRAVVRWVTYRTPDHTDERVGVIKGDEIFGAQPGTGLVGLLEAHENLVVAGQGLLEHPHEVMAVDAVELRAPVPRPPSIRDFLAFEEHLRNARAARGEGVDPDWYQLPVFYFSNPAAVHGPNDDVAVAPGCQRWDYELEAAVVIGRAGGDLTPAEADKVIAGYTILCDFSARDLQAREMKLGLGPAKGKDSATSLGPVLVTPDELEPFRSGHAFALTMTASVNGREYSRGNLGDIYWSFGEMIAYASRGTTLVPGDVIGSGTVGSGCILELAGLHGEEAYPWLRPGDELSLEIERIGVLRHRIVPGRPPLPLR